ncbi:MAG: TlyA family RNA methyltransferase [Nocardioides sp.]
MSPRRLRLDAELVRRGLARSRDQASALIRSGRVRVDGLVARKPATGVGTDVAIVIREGDTEPDYVSRGGHKLRGAVAAFEPRGLRIAGRRCLDAGASTGGFTDVLLRADAAEVVAVDVGYGQLAWAIRQDPRVRVLERTNMRTLEPAVIGDPVDLIVGDLSFISLTLLVDPMVTLLRPDGDLVLMVKPQFEVGRQQLGTGGVVRDPRLWQMAVDGVISAAARLGWGAHGVAVSPLPGPAGNIEFFVWFRNGPAVTTTQDVRRVVNSAGPDEKVDS